MINIINLAKLKQILLKNFENQRVCIELKGFISTSIFLDNAKILVNNKKLIVVDDTNEFELEFLLIKKIKFNDLWQIQIYFEDLTVTLEL